jgi:hypothetical protein
LVHINQVELHQFKSFGGSMTIPLEQGFTVVTGPNGSGKSNILDGVLFCLGLASSRGMRAERLPDLINSAMLRAGKAAETVVSVRFDLRDWQPDEAEAGLEPPGEGPWIRPGQSEWTVTRRLRVAPGGTYASSFSADGTPCNLQQLQTQLRRLRVDPEGSNVVMQGDVTRIVSMGARDRRGIIDELAGVALFDSRIEQTRAKLDEVQERQERCSIVQQELLAARVRLERDCARLRRWWSLLGDSRPGGLGGLAEPTRLDLQREIDAGDRATVNSLREAYVSWQQQGDAPWAVDGRVGKSLRTYRRSVSGQAWRRHPHQGGRRPGLDWHRRRHGGCEQRQGQAGAPSEAEQGHECASDNGSFWTAPLGMAMAPASGPAGGVATCELRPPGCAGHLPGNQLWRSHPRPQRLRRRPASAPAVGALVVRLRRGNPAPLPAQRAAGVAAAPHLRHPHAR